MLLRRSVACALLAKADPRSPHRPVEGVKGSPSKGERAKEPSRGSRLARRECLPRAFLWACTHPFPSPCCVSFAEVPRVARGVGWVTAGGAEPPRRRPNAAPLAASVPLLPRPTQNPETLLIFAAGNEGDQSQGSSRSTCTIGSPAISKNVLAVGATSSGETRVTATGADGNMHVGDGEYADIDTVAFFSSYGPTLEGRIKPEVVAPGDQVSPIGSSDPSDLATDRASVLGGCMVEEILQFSRRILGLYSEGT